MLNIRSFPIQVRSLPSSLFLQKKGFCCAGAHVLDMKGAGQPAALPSPSMQCILCIASSSSRRFSSLLTLSLGAMSPTMAVAGETKLRGFAEQQQRSAEHSRGGRVHTCLRLVRATQLHTA